MPLRFHHYRLVMGSIGSLSLWALLPGGVQAGPEEATLASLQAVEDILAKEGFELTFSPADSHRPGGVVVKGERGAFDQVVADCIGVDPIVKAMPAWEGARGVSADAARRLGLPGKTVATGADLRFTLTSVEFWTIPLGKIQPSRSCQEEVSRAGRMVDLTNAELVYEVVVAKVHTGDCIASSVGDVLSSGGTLRSATLPPCSGKTGSAVVLGFKSVPVRAVFQAGEASSSGGRLAGERWLGQAGYEMALVPSGRYELGCTAGQTACEGTDSLHEVELRRSFYVGRFEVTQGLWLRVMEDQPSHFTECGPNCPVEQVSWLDAVRFANRMSEHEHLPPCYVIEGSSVRWPDGPQCTGYRLPTEAEWEVAARGGRDTSFSGGMNLGVVGWYFGNSRSRTHPVGQMEPNSYGLYDMSGNVWEWVWDVYADYPRYSTDPRGPEVGHGRVARGGCWSGVPSRAAVPFRYRASPGSVRNDLGFRLVRTAQ